MVDRGAAVHDVLDRVANRWTALAVEALAGGTKRYGEVRRELGGVSHKMLAQTLRGLERDGIVTRTVYPVVPPKVEYALTPLGETLVEPLAAICRWAREHRVEIEAARASADRVEALGGSRGSRASTPAPVSRPRGGTTGSGVM